MRGRRLVPFRGSRIRPTSDKVREAIFSILGQDMTGVRVLDLFAGTGVQGIEALSRGAQTGIFVDHSPEALQLIRRNLVLCGYEQRSTLLRKDLGKGLPGRLNVPEEGFDLVFIDPPYRKGLLVPSLQALAGRRIISSNAMIVTEAAGDEKLPDRVGTLICAKTRIYGDTKIGIYSYGGNMP